MKIRRAALAVVALLVAATALPGCGSASDAAGGAQVKELRYQGWVGQVLLPELAEDLGYLGDVKLKWIGNTISGPQDIQAATTGDTDFGGAFNGAIVKLAAAKAPIKAVIGYYGVRQAQTFNGFYVLDGSPIKTRPGPDRQEDRREHPRRARRGGHQDLPGPRRAHRRGDQAGRADRRAAGEHRAVAAARGRSTWPSLSQTLRDKALERGGIHPLFTDFDLLGTFTAGSYVLRTDFIKKNPDTVRTFVTGVAKAIEWSKTQPREVVIARFEEICTSAAATRTTASSSSGRATASPARAASSPTRTSAPGSTG